MSTISVLGCFVSSFIFYLMAVLLFKSSKLFNLVNIFVRLNKLFV